MSNILTFESFLCLCVFDFSSSVQYTDNREINIGIYVLFILIWMDQENKTFLKVSCLMNAAYYLSLFNLGGKSCRVKELENMEQPAKRVICIHLFILSVLISSLSAMQHHFPRAILQ